MLEHSNQERSEDMPLQTFKRSFEAILAGEDAWIPLGNFMEFLRL